MIDLRCKVEGELTGLSQLNMLVGITKARCLMLNVNVGEPWVGSVNRHRLYALIYGNNHTSHMDTLDKRSINVYSESDYVKEVIAVIWKDTTDAELVERYNLICGNDGLIAKGQKRGNWQERARKKMMQSGEPVFELTNKFRRDVGIEEIKPEGNL